MPIEFSKVAFRISVLLVPKQTTTFTSYNHPSCSKMTRHEYISYISYLQGSWVVLAGDQAREKLVKPDKEPSGDTVYRYNIFGRNVDVNAIKKACNKLQL